MAPYLKIIKTRAVSQGQSNSQNKNNGSSLGVFYSFVQENSKATSPEPIVGAQL